MGIFNHHYATKSADSANTEGFHMSDNEHENQTSSEHNTTSSSPNTAGSQTKSGCGCGCAHKTKGLADEEVVEIKEEEWY